MVKKNSLEAIGRFISPNKNKIRPTAGGARQITIVWKRENGVEAPSKLEGTLVKAGINAKMYWSVGAKTMMAHVLSEGTLVSARTENVERLELVSGTNERVCCMVGAKPIIGHALNGGSLYHFASARINTTVYWSVGGTTVMGHDLNEEPQNNITIKNG